MNYRLGQVGGFPLRVSWLPRLVNFGEDKKCDLFKDQEEIAQKMGIGMNMVKALRLWAKCTGIIDESDTITKRGMKLFSSQKGVDKYIERDETLWVLHWLICSNTEYSMANGWLLNFFHSRNFVMKDLLDAFASHLKGKREKPYALGTIEVDIKTAMRMYTIIDEKADMRGIDDHYFRAMRLFFVNRTAGETRYTRHLRDVRPRVGDKVIVYAVIDAMLKRGVSNSSFSDMYAGDKVNAPAPGVVFGFTKDGFFMALENAVQKHPKILSMHSMPDGDFNVRLHGKYKELAEAGNASTADDFYFSARGRR